jgi:hypothetical protein
MSNFNEYNISRWASVSAYLASLYRSLKRRKKTAHSSGGPSFLSKFNPKTEKYENFSIFKDDLELPGP